MRRTILCICGALALFAVAAFAAPAVACGTSRPVFNADSVRTYGPGQVRVRVVQALMIGARLAAVRAIVLAGSGIARAGDRIVIVVPPNDTANCYYAGLADPGTITAEGSLEGYVALTAMRALPGTFSGWPASENDRSRYSAFAQGRLPGQWVRARFTAAGEPSQ
jgi:hypothetical protein